MGRTSVIVLLKPEAMFHSWMFLTPPRFLAKQSGWCGTCWKKSTINSDKLGDLGVVPLCSVTKYHLWWCCVAIYPFYEAIHGVACKPRSRWKLSDVWRELRIEIGMAKWKIYTLQFQKQNCMHSLTWPSVGMLSHEVENTTEFDDQSRKTCRSQGNQSHTDLFSCWKFWSAKKRLAESLCWHGPTMTYSKILDWQSHDVEIWTCFGTYFSRHCLHTLGILRYPLVIKHGVLENTLFSSVIFLLKPPFLVDFQWPRLMTPEGTLW